MSAVVQEAESFLGGAYVALGERRPPQTPTDWHRDPETGCRAPRLWAYGISVRDPGTVGNVKATWEHSEHHHLTVLALAYHLTGREAFAAAVENQLQSWVEANPVLEGVNWASPLELAVRLLSWTWIDRLLRGSAQGERLFGDEGLLWPSIYWHQRVIGGDWSVGSSANDHLVGEMTGQFISTTLWPRFRMSQSWRLRARSRLEREMFRQTFRDGLNREQAFGYHVYTAAFFLLAAIEAERAGEPFSWGYRERLAAMLSAVGRLRDVAGHLPRYGDADDALPVQLYASSLPLPDWLAAVGHAWRCCGRLVPTTVAGGAQGRAARVTPGMRSEFTGLALAILDLPERDAGECVPDERQTRDSDAFRDAGVYVLASRRWEPDEVLCIFDAGPLGLPSLGAHGHADALSITLSVGGYPILVDPGTFTYHQWPAWRQYFRGTAAHNTVVIDGLDQSEPGGPFLWRRWANTRLAMWEPAPDGGEVCAMHDGYARLPSPAWHRRCIQVRDRKIEVVDGLEGEDTHDLLVRWHFAPECNVVLSRTRCVATRGGVTVTMVLDSACHWTVCEGGPDGGWYSPRFNALQATTTLSGRVRTSLPTELTTRMQVRVRPRT